MTASEEVTEDQPPKKRFAKTKEVAKSAATPGSIVLAIATAVTAYYKAQDTTIEQKTYETLATQITVIQAQNTNLNERMGRFEQALFITAMNGNKITAPPPPPQPAGTEEGTGLGSGFGSGAGRLGGSAREAPPAAGPSIDELLDGALMGARATSMPREEAPIVRRVHRPRPAAPAAQPAPTPVDEGPSTVDKVAELLGRKVEIKDGALQVEPAPAPAKKMDKLPSWDDIQVE